MQIKISSGVLNVDGIIGAPPPEDPGPPVPIGPGIEPPLARLPYFDIGEATGKAGETVSLSVEGGCRFLTNGFHIGGGCAGYGKFEAVGVKLGAFLRGYLQAEDMIHDQPMHQHEHFWSIFKMVKGGTPAYALPEEWWEFAMAFFSLDQKRTVPPVTIPSGVELFTLEVKILADTPPGNYQFSCKDEHYYTQPHQRRRDFMYTTDRDSEFARGGITKLDLTGGEITVIA